MTNIERIYVYLLDEGIDVWRPVEAIKLDENLYKITSMLDSGESENPEFGVDDVVKTIDKILSGGFEAAERKKVAISKIN